MPGAPLIVALVARLRDLPDWARFAVVGGALVLLTVLVVGYPLARAEAALGAANSNTVKIEQQQRQLDRIEGKLDKLLIHLIPHK